MRHFKTLLLSLLLCCIAYLSCKKDNPPEPQLVKGTVLDKKTGKPVPGATVILTYSSPGDGDPYDRLVFRFLETNYKGTFEHTDKPGFDFLGLHRVDKDGYIFCQTKGCGVSLDTPIDSIVVNITPLDGVLRLEANNITGQNASLYIAFSYKTLIESAAGIAEYSLFPIYPVNQTEGSSFQGYDHFPTDETIYINWSFSSSFSPFFIDSFIINMDTLKYKIDY